MPADFAADVLREVSRYFPAHDQPTLKVSSTGLAIYAPNWTSPKRNQS